MSVLQMILPWLVAIVAAFCFTKLLIPALQKSHTEQSIREDGPQSHLSKAGTPTMGGIAIIAAAVVGTLLGGITVDIIIMLAVFLAFGALGFLDDFIKVTKKHNLGLRAWQKLVIQIVIAVALAIYMAKSSILGTIVFIPIVNTFVDIGFLYIPFVAFVVVSMTNAVNLTDGLDGLASGVTTIVAAFFAILGFTFGMDAPRAFCMAISGACIGFLWFNKNPAKIFMGDTGSLALGGGLAAAAIMMHMELMLLIAGFVYVAEALSVIIQVVSFKSTGKRVFKMAPLHHHFELSGLKEKQVVGLFWLASLICCVLGIVLL